MFKLDNDFLVTLGLGSMPVQDKNKLLQMIYEKLEMNVGMRLAEKMTDQQLDEFESFIDRNDEAGALRWLETNFPNYKQVVAEELEKLKIDVQAAAPQILASAQANIQSAPSTQPQPMQQNLPGAQPVNSAYNPENPFQAHNPEYGNEVASQAPQQPPAQSYSPAAYQGNVNPQYPQPAASNPGPVLGQPFAAPAYGGQAPQPQADSAWQNSVPPTPQQYSQPQPFMPHPTQQSPQSWSPPPQNPSTQPPAGFPPIQQ